MDRFSLAYASRAAAVNGQEFFPKIVTFRLMASPWGGFPWKSVKDII
jgi:hypothetical protein